MAKADKPWIDKALASIAAEGPQAWSRPDVYQFIQQHMEEWQASGSYQPYEILKLLMKRQGILQVAVDRIGDGGEVIPGGMKRYVAGKASAYSIALTLKKGSYLSHASAVFAHGLSHQIPRTVYANKEQSPKPRPKGGLTQEGIDKAFRNNPRTSTYTFAYQGTQILLLSGKATGHLGVETIELPTGEIVEATNLERTLIDITVRPVYAGGVFEVMKVFKAAAGRLSMKKLIGTLKKLDYVYPYHQALGFYLSQAGFSEKELIGLQDLGLHHDFYLTNKMTRPAYDSTWKLFYPSETKFLR